MTTPEPSDANSVVRHLDRSWKWLLFSFDGRASRSDYWRGTLAAFVLWSVSISALAVPLLLVGEFDWDEPALIVASLGWLGLTLIPLFWASLAITVKRWHDRNKNGAWVLIGLVPYIGSLWVFVECGLVRGTPGDNDYGPDPLA